MGDKKHIDRLFQERFKDFEVTPDSDIWSRIQDELGHKKKRRVIPFWMQLGGIAAAIALLFMLGYNLFSGEENQLVEPQIVNEEVKKDALPTGLENENTNAIEAQQNEITIDEAIVDNNNNNESELVVAKSNSTNNATEKDANSNLTNAKIKTNAVTVQNKAKENPAANKSNLTDKNVQLTKNEGVAANGNTPALKTKVIDEDPYKKDTNELMKDVDTKNAVAALVEKEKEDKTNAAQMGIINKEAEVKNSTAVTSTDTDATEKNEVKEENKLPSILDAIDQEEKNTDIAKVELTNEKRWSLNPMVAPVYYNTVGEGSPIHSQFKDNAKSGDINLSYGVGVAYQVSKRLSVRSGVNVVNLGYETEEIAFTASLDGGNLENISYNSNTSRLDVKDRSPGSAGGLEASDVPNDFSTNRSAAETAGVMSQQFGYVEVPVELKYRLVDKKIGINVIGGLSSLFLTDNSISLESDNLVTDVGEANNVNNMSFTTNVGLGIDYALNKNLQLNLEPIFKYQLNAFNREAGDFKPYYLGVYTGVSFKF